MAEFDPDAFLKSPAPAAPAFDPDAFVAGPEQPKSIGRAAQDLPRDMQMRADYLKKLVEAKGEPGYGTRLADSFTFGLMRPISGATAAISGEGTAGERYRAAVGAEEDYAKRAERNTNPYLGAAADVVGGIASGGPALGLAKGAAAKVAVEAPSKAAQLAKLMVGNTGSGVIEGAARNAESPENAAVGGLVGGATGAVTGKVVGAASKLLPGVKAAQKEVAGAVREGGSKALKEEGSKVYTALDQAGIHFQDASPLVADTVKTMKDKGFNYAAGIHGDLVPVAERIGKLNGKPTTWNELQQIREQLSAVKASDNDQARRMAGHMANTLDNFVDTARATIPANKLGTVSPGDPEKARDLWRRGSQAENAEWLTKKGMATTPNPGRKLETNFGSELDRINNPKRFSTHQGSPEQAAQIETIAKGDPKRAQLAEFLRQQSGKLVGLGALGTSAGAGGLYAGDTTGVGSGVGAGGIATLATGLAGKAGAGKLRQGIAARGQERVNDLIRNIVTGSTNRSVINTPRDALAKLMAKDQLARGAGRYSSSLFNRE